VVAAAHYVVGVLSTAAARPEAWEAPAGQLEWSCRRTLAHALDACNWYAALVARQATGDIEVAEMDPTASPEILLDATTSAAAVVGSVTAGAGPGVRAWHAFGISDACGFAAMGADELLVHGADVAAGLSLDFSPPPELCRPAVERLFPWAPREETAADPWGVLLWANGRAPLGSRPPAKDWIWNCPPVEEWDGTVPGREPRR